MNYIHLHKEIWPGFLHSPNIMYTFRDSNSIGFCKRLEYDSSACIIILMYGVVQKSFQNKYLLLFAVFKPLNQTVLKENLIKK